MGHAKNLDLKIFVLRNCYHNSFSKYNVGYIIAPRFAEYETNITIISCMNKTLIPEKIRLENLYSLDFSVISQMFINAPNKPGRIQSAPSTVGPVDKNREEKKVLF